MGAGREGLVLALIQTLLSKDRDMRAVPLGEKSCWLSRERRQTSFLSHSQLSVQTMAVQVLQPQLPTRESGDAARGHAGEKGASSQTAGTAGHPSNDTPCEWRLSTSLHN